MKPILIDLAGLKVFSYPLMMGIAWGVGWHLANSLLYDLKINRKGFSLLFWGSFVLSWIGAKVFFLVNSSFGQATYIAGHSSFWLGGGFVFYGGFVFGALWWALYCLILKKFEAKNLFILIPSIAFGHAIGRIGCFLAGCCYGTKCNLPWAIYLERANRHPVQLYEAVILTIIGTLTLYLIKVKKASGTLVVSTYVILYSISRFILEEFRGDIVRGSTEAGLSPSQWVSISIWIIFFGIFIGKKLIRR